MLVGALVIGEFAGCGPVKDAVTGLWGYDGDASGCGLEGLDLRLGKVARAYDDAGASGEF